MEGISPTSPGILPTNRIQVPYVAEDARDEDHVSFYEFPRHRGIASIKDPVSLRHYFSTISPASFTQAWLFFRLLRAFLCHPIQHSDFVSNGMIDLGQDAVEDHFKRWKSELWKASYAKKRQFQTAIEAMIRYALESSDALEEATKSLRPRDMDFDCVVLSVKLLAGVLRAVLEDTFSKSSGLWAPWAINAFSRQGRILGRILRTRYNPFIGLMPPVAEDYIMEMGSRDARKILHGGDLLQPVLSAGDDGGSTARLLIRMFESNGWCPFRARQLCQTYDILTLNNLAGFVKQSSFSEDHGQCLEAKRCTAHDVVGIDQAGNYSLRHDTGECHGTCTLIKIPYNELADIIRSGDKPIVSVAFEGPLDLKVIRCTPYTTYTAVSHVWSDGRGNPNENALPSCQVLWLRDKIQQSYHGQYSPFYDESSFRRSIIHFIYFSLSQSLGSGRPHTSINKKRVNFWMDTFCIPVVPEAEANEESKKLRLRAIKQITPIFAGAYNALILDRGLEETVSPSPASMVGDEFASYLLGCTWMERGWTLQEGSLSHRSVVQLMGKPFEMTMALRNLMPSMDTITSPLARANMKIRRSMILLVRKQLLEYKRQIMIDHWPPRAKRISRQLQTPLFVWIWNSLINRATTRPDDGVLIFASLLDFDVYQLRLVPQKERLMRVIQGCEELPLSLMYNTGPRVCIEGHPELNWVPEDVKGDALVGGPVLRRLKSRRADAPAVYSIDHNRRDDDSLLVYTTVEGQYISPNSASLQIVASVDGRHATPYMIDLQRADISCVPADRNDGQCIIIDLACGVNSLRGAAGRGALFTIVSRGEDAWTVQCEAPLIARTVEQWAHQSERPAVPELVCMKRVTRRQKIVMVYEASVWNTQLARRPLYNMYPVWTRIIGMLSLLVVQAIAMNIANQVLAKLIDLGYLPRLLSGMGTFLILALFPLTMASVWLPIERRLAMFGYIKWLKTFDDRSEEPSETRRTSLYARRIAVAGRRMVTGLRWAWVRVTGRRERDDAVAPDELPGDIYLE